MVMAGISRPRSLDPLLFGVAARRDGSRLFFGVKEKGRNEGAAKPLPIQAVCWVDIDLGAILLHQSKYNKKVSTD